MNFNHNLKVNVKQKITSNLIVMFLAIFLVSYFAIYLAIQDINKLRSEIISEKIEIEKRVNREQNLSNLAVKLKKIELNSEQIDNIFIAKDNELDFIKTLEDIATYNNVMQNINLLPDKTNVKGISKTVVNIIIEGTYENVLNYLRDIESLPHYINVNYLSLGNVQGNKNGEVENSVKLTISAETFWK